VSVSTHSTGLSLSPGVSELTDVSCLPASPLNIQAPALWGPFPEVSGVVIPTSSLSAPALGMVAVSQVAPLFYLKSHLPIFFISP
jgi:hypothetical protein